MPSQLVARVRAGTAWDGCKAPFGLSQAQLLKSCGTSAYKSLNACLQVSGHPAVAPHMTKFYGIRNGIDQDIWDPLEDRFLPRSARLLPAAPSQHPVLYQLT